MNILQLLVQGQQNRENVRLKLATFILTSNAVTRLRYEDLIYTQEIKRLQALINENINFEVMK